MLNLQTHHGSALSEAGPLSCLDQHHWLFLFLLCEARPTYVNDYNRRSRSRNVYSALPCGIRTRISCSFCCYCCLKINPDTQSGRDKHDQEQQSMHKDLQRNFRSKDHIINLLFSLNIILSKLIYCLHTTKDREFLERERKKPKSWKGTKATSRRIVTTRSQRLLKANQTNATPFHRQAARSRSLRHQNYLSKSETETWLVQHFG